MMIPITKKYEEFYRNRRYDNLYIVVDIHGTIFIPTFKKEEVYQYYPYAKECLQELSKDPNVKLILWSGCFKDVFNEYIKKFEQDGIKFDYVNENPECKNSDYACFDKKFYFDIGIDDKFGFDALNDWREFYPLIIKNK